MLPIRGEECLLGHNKRFPEGFYSAFAGFLEPGETMEEAVKRGIERRGRSPSRRGPLSRLATLAFSVILMLGCYAEALSKDFRIDGKEIGSARWISKQEIRERLAGGKDDGVKLPAAIAIARSLIADWVAS